MRAFPISRSREALYEATFGCRSSQSFSAFLTTIGKAEALKRLKAGFQHTESQSAGGFVAFQNKWSGDHLDFRASLLSQTTTGTVDVAEDHVRLEVKLPWLLSLLANRAKGLVQKQAKLMLEKPSNTRT